jgi:hypothetical protein
MTEKSEPELFEKSEVEAAELRADRTRILASTSLDIATAAALDQTPVVQRLSWNEGPNGTFAMIAMPLQSSKASRVHGHIL